MSKYGQWTINKLDDRASVEVRNIKSKASVDLQVKDTAIEIVEARSSVFNEQESHWTLPLSNSSVVIGLAVTLGILIISFLSPIASF